MSRVITEDSNVTIDKAQSSDNLFKPYMEIWSSYFEDIAAACSFENGFFEYLVTGVIQYFVSLMSFYKNLNQMYVIVCLAWDLSRSFGHKQ